MGRTFTSVRQEINAISERWIRVSRKLKQEDQTTGQYTAAITKRYSSECFMGMNSGLEGALFSAPVAIQKGREKMTGVEKDDP